MRSANNQSDSESIYFNEMSQINVLPHEELMELVERAQAGDKMARTRCAEANLRSVVMIARQHYRSNSSLSLSDLIQEGNIGLMKAIDRFDVKSGNRLLTYAQWWIRAEIMQAINNTSRTIRMPVRVAQATYRTSRLENKLTNELGREPTEDELHKYLAANGYDNEKGLNRILEAGRTSVKSIHGNPDAVGLEDRLADPDAFDVDSMIRDMDIPDLEQMFSILTEKERAVLIGRFHKDQTLKEVGKELGLTRERIRQIQVQAIKKLRNQLGCVFTEYQEAS